MNRAAASLLLSVFLHAGLLWVFAPVFSEGKREETNAVIRVVFNGNAREAHKAGKAEPEKFEPEKPAVPVPVPPAAKPEPKPKPQPKSRPKTSPKPRQSPTKKSRENTVPTAAEREDGPSQVGGSPHGGLPHGGSPHGDMPRQLSSTETRRSTSVIDAEKLKVTRRIKPDYPMISRKRKEQGTVVLLIDVIAGQVTSVRLERGSGYPALDESAAKAARGWRFETSGHGDKIVARITFRFELK
ncbi:MAG: energy transducer TonB [Synergistaceae bacterium]|jgi:protein TonB|nr:energy transducer TonB [Synergistaceae bacterium]